MSSISSSSFLRSNLRRWSYTSAHMSNNSSSFFFTLTNTSFILFTSNLNFSNLHQMIHLFPIRGICSLLSPTASTTQIVLSSYLFESTFYCKQTNNTTSPNFLYYKNCFLCVCIHSHLSSVKDKKEKKK